MQVRGQVREAMRFAQKFDSIALSRRRCRGSFKICRFRIDEAVDPVFCLFESAHVFEVQRCAKGADRSQHLRDFINVLEIYERARLTNARFWVPAIRAQQPDLVFLDVQMPGLDGFGVIKKLLDKKVAMPQIIFSTAFDQYAVKAFEVNAVDYLLKPFTKERFERALDRVRERRAAGEDIAYRARVSKVLASLGNDRARARLPIKTENGTYLIATEKVDWAQAERNCIRVHAGALHARIRETMAHFCERLPAGDFIRIHRSVVVNIDRIERIEPWAHGEYIVGLRDGTKLKSSRLYAQSLRDLQR